MITASVVTYNHHLLDFEPVLRSLFASPVQTIFVVDHSDSMLDLKAELQEFAERVLKGEPELKLKAERGFQLIYIPHENNGYGGGHNVALKAAMEQGIIRSNETVTVISTGSGLKDTANALKAAGKPYICAPSLDALEKSGILK